MFLKNLRPALVTLALFSVLTGLAYPLAVTAIGQLLFPENANGSLIRTDTTVIGSGLIGQSFTGPRYFWGRPSFTGSIPYDASSSLGSNYGPLNSTFLDTVKRRVELLRAADPGNAALIPVDLVTSSGSGLDRHISVVAAMYQLPRVARVRGRREEDIRAIVDRHTEGRQLGFLGEARVNVLLLNLELDGRVNSAGGK
jgi:potassium-transporting ATPase KdpC subunit